MSFIKVTVKQQAEGTPGFVEEETFEIQINTDQITLFNKSLDDPSITFVRLTCGATLVLDMKYTEFVKLLNTHTEGVVKK